MWRTWGRQTDSCLLFHYWRSARTGSTRFPIQVSVIVYMLSVFVSKLLSFSKHPDVVLAYTCLNSGFFLNPWVFWCCHKAEHKTRKSPSLEGSRGGEASCPTGLPKDDLLQGCWRKIKGARLSTLLTACFPCPFPVSQQKTVFKP